MVVSKDIAEQLSKDALYSNYIDRQKKDVEKLKRDEKHKIPRNFIYAEISGLSAELMGKLELVRPSNLSQASRIDGMTPAGLALILGRIRFLEKKSA